MKCFRKEIVSFILITFLSANAICQDMTNSVTESDVKVEKRKKKKKKYKLPKVDLSHWKVTIPEGSGKGGAISVEPPEILDYATNEVLKPYMYNDSTTGAITFYAYPSKATTANTKYSRSELREQMVPGEDNVNWTFADGGYLRAKMAIDEISKKDDGKYHRTIVTQIHGRLTNEQKEFIGQKDNNAPPILKIYWKDGKIRVKTKVLKYAGVSDEGILLKEAWGDDEGRTFEEEVGFRKFVIEVKVSDGKMVVSLNKNEFFVYDSQSIKRWGVFENYFKVGNYFQTRDKGAYAKVNLYELSVEH
ncbi:polysaccharide lyase family 7 protein [Flagellimonas sp. HMM57]|uniref:polysaccharide lyase family 7 protein n=1 Tax=unclassified Flagellimonas TaxID=2644544 RepID=UPI0013D80C87|nr:MULTISPECIES: polysaccharide lyase family 7 protein [unclassified Flagellimonas]UII76785.1 polysaccharide lyase family 7 protein [Flagellimonas sp. HMM57]